MAGGLHKSPEGRHVFPGLTVMENLEMGAFFKENREENQANLKKVFTFPNVLKNGRTKMQPPFRGEQQMLAMGRALMSTIQNFFFR